MKPYPICITFFISTCTTAAPVSNQHDLTSNALAAFERICLETAPNFAAAEKIALDNYGIKDFKTEMLDIKQGESNQGYSVNFKEGLSCSVIYASQKDDTITSRFLTLVQKYAKQGIIREEPATIRIEGKTFMVMHERKNAEMFILLKAD